MSEEWLEWEEETDDFQRRQLGASSGSALPKKTFPSLTATSSSKPDVSLQGMDSAVSAEKGDTLVSTALAAASSSRPVLGAPGRDWSQQHVERMVQEQPSPGQPIKHPASDNALLQAHLDQLKQIGGGAVSATATSTTEEADPESPRSAVGSAVSAAHSNVSAANSAVSAAQSNVSAANSNVSVANSNVSAANSNASAASSVPPDPIFNPEDDDWDDASQTAIDPGFLLPPPIELDGEYVREIP